MIVNLSSVRSAHQKLINQTASGIILELADAGKFAVDYVSAQPTFKPRTGELQAKTRWVPFRGNAIKVQNTAPHNQFVEYGTRPHVIKPRRKGGSLRFVVKGKVVFTKRVNHPGNRPFKFLYRATFAAGRILHQGLENRMQRAAREFSSSR